MKSLVLRAALAVSLSSLALSAHAAVTLTGAGATFPYPLYAKWAEAYKAKTGVAMNYQSIGSGGGIKQIKAKTVNFGASDKPLKPEELASSNLVQFPTVMGGVVPVINVPGIANNQLKLSGSLLADIFMGKVKKWNDPAIVALNAGVALPDTAITVVHRSDGSGTTFIFTNYLSKVSAEWKTKVGEDASVQWPAGLGGKGNEGVASFVQKVKGSIGYVEYSYALQSKMPTAQLKNRDGQFTTASEESFKAAAANVDWNKTPGFYALLTEQAGAKTWPIAGATFILIQKMQDNGDTAREVLKFFDWAYANGDAMALQLDYIPMPDNVINTIRASWKNIKDEDGNVVWK